MQKRLAAHTPTCTHAHTPAHALCARTRIMRPVREGFINYIISSQRDYIIYNLQRSPAQASVSWVKNLMNKSSYFCIHSIMNNNE